MRDFNPPPYEPTRLALKAVLREEGQLLKYMEYYRTIPYLDVRMYAVKMMARLAENLGKNGVDGIESLNVIQGLYDAFRDELEWRNPTSAKDATDFVKCIVTHIQQDSSFPEDGAVDKVFEALDAKGIIKPMVTLNEFTEALIEADFMVAAHTAGKNHFRVNLQTHEPL